MPALTLTLQTICADPHNLTFTITGPAQSPPKEAELVLYAFQPYEWEAPLSPERAVAALPLQSTQVDDQWIFRLPRFDGPRDRIYDRFRAALHLPGEQPLALGGVMHVDCLQNIAAWEEPYPTSTTIKGLQVHMVEDAVALGVGHAALNLNLPTILRPAQTESTVTFRMDGRDFYFDGAYLARFDQRLKELSDRGIIVTLILLNSMKWDEVEIHSDLRPILPHPAYDPEGLISAFNVIQPQALEYYKAFVEFVSWRYMQPGSPYGRACGLIIGNEVDSQWIWGNAGEMEVQQYVREHALAMRTAFYAARKHWSEARVYLSLDHLWSMAYQDQPTRYYRGRDILEGLNAIYLAEGNYDWSLAYHPYPEDLVHSAFWHDKTALLDFDTPRITFKNIEILPQYLSRPHLLYDGRLRHIILSEQGFNSLETEESERIQAAAYAYAYWRIERTPGIESFILHAHVDNRDEFGLNLGLWRRDKSSPLANAPSSPKPIYEVFKGIDGPERETILAQARAVVGEDNWKEPVVEEAAP
jgi:hypothetical protein